MKLIYTNLFKLFKNQMCTLFSQRAILLSLVSKNLKAKYAGSVFGILWAFINPLLLALVVGFVFTEILKMNMENSYLFIMSGMLPWAFLANSLQEAVVSIPANANILKQFMIPREFIPIAIVLSNFVLFLLSLSVIMPVFLFFKILGVFMLPLLLVVVVLQCFFILGLALLLAVAYVYFRDMNQLLNIFLLFWLWLTPIFYSVEMIPAAYRGIFYFNPMTLYINLYRNAFFCSCSHSVQWLVQALLLSVMSVAIGYYVFCRWGKDVLKRI